MSLRQPSSGFCHALTCVWLLAALLVRIVYVPYHLAIEEHAEAHAHAVAINAEHHDHAPDESEHPPHSEADHESDWLTSRSASAKLVMQPAVQPDCELAALPLRLDVQPFTGHVPSRPESGPARAWASRGPPLTV